MATDETKCPLKNGQCMGAGAQTTKGYSCVGGGDPQCGVNYIAGKCGLSGAKKPLTTGKKCWQDQDCPKGKLDGCSSAIGGPNPKCHVSESELCLVSNGCNWGPLPVSGKCFAVQDGSHIGKTCENLLSEYGESHPADIEQRAKCDPGYKLGIKGTGRILPALGKTAPGPCQFECIKAGGAGEPCIRDPGYPDVMGVCNKGLACIPTEDGGWCGTFECDGDSGTCAAQNIECKSGAKNCYTSMEACEDNCKKIPPPAYCCSTGEKPGIEDSDCKGFRSSPGMCNADRGCKPQSTPCGGPNPLKCTPIGDPCGSDVAGIGCCSGTSCVNNKCKKNPPPSTPPKDNTVLIIVLVVLALLILGVGGFLIYGEFNKK